MTMTITPPIQKHQTVRHTINRLLALCLALAFAPLPAGAAGLGNVSGNPVMGEPFVLEVPLIDAGDLAAECIQLTPHSAGSDSQFFPRKATFDLKKKAGSTQTVITIRGAEFTQPVLEFRLTIGCGNQISRDYALLPSPSRELHYEPVQINKAAVMPVPESPSPAVVKNMGNAVAPAGPSLEKMAKQRYPLQPKARAKFKHMVRDANPAALEGVADNAPLPTNADLQIPANIPKKRVGPYIPKVKKAPTAPASTPRPAETAPPPEQARAPAPTEKPAPAPVAAETPKDRLIISSGAGAPGATQPVGTAEGALQEKAAASFATQDEMATKLAQSESSYNELKQQILAMESRMAVLEQERQRLQQEAMKKSDWPLLETTVLILVGGLLGAMLMIIMQRRRSRSSYETPTFDIGAIGRK
jgi:hypothetical protein